MTTDRDFDRIATAWLADGPEELSDRVLDAVVDQIHTTRQRHALAPAVEVPNDDHARSRRGDRRRRCPRPGRGRRRSAAPAAADPARRRPRPAAGGGAVGRAVRDPRPAACPVLDTLFTSPRNGYSVKYPAGWTVRPATQSWQPGKRILWGDPALDAIQTTRCPVRRGRRRQLAAGQSAAEQWLKAYCLDAAATDSGARATTVAGVVGAGSRSRAPDAYIDLDGDRGCRRHRSPRAGRSSTPCGRRDAIGRNVDGRWDAPVRLVRVRSGGTPPTSPA